MLNQYIYKNQECSARAVEAWQARSPDWAEAIREAVDQPAHFVALIGDMLRTIKGLDH